MEGLRRSAPQAGPLSAIRSLIAFGPRPAPPRSDTRVRALSVRPGLARLPVGAPRKWPEGFRPEVRDRSPGVACKPGSVPTPGCPGAGEDHSSRPAIAGWLEHSHPDTPTGPRGPSVRADRSRRYPYSSLLQEGLAPPPVTRLSRVGSYPTISPLPVPSSSGEEEGHRRCGFCGAFPRVTPGRRYRPPCPVEPGLSSRERCVFTGDLPATSGGPSNRIARRLPRAMVAWTSWRLNGSLYLQF